MHSWEVPGVENGVDNGVDNGGSSKGHLGHLALPKGKDGSLLFASCVLRLFAVVPTQVSSCSGAAMIALTASVFLSAATIAALLLWISSVKTAHRWGGGERERERERKRYSDVCAVCLCAVYRVPCTLLCALCAVYRVLLLTYTFLYNPTGPHTVCSVRTMAY